MTGPIKPKKTQRTSVGGRFGESGRSARLAATKRGDPREGRAARAQRTPDQIGEYMSRDQLGRDTIDPESLKVALGTPSSGSGIPGGVGTGSTAVSVTKTTVVDSDVNVFVDGSLIGSRDGIDLVAGTNVTLAAVDDASNDKVSVTINASGGGSGISDGDYGDVTVSGGGAALTIDANVVTFAKMQAVSANVLLGNDASGTAVEEITCTAAGRAILDDANAAAQLATLGAVSTSLGVIGNAPITSSGVDLTTPIEFSVDQAGLGTTGVIALSGDLGGTATAPVVVNDAITYAKMQNVSAASRVLGRGSAGGSGDVEELTAAGGLKIVSTTITNELVFVATPADVAINSTSDVTIVTRNVTDVAAGDQLMVEGHFVIVSNDTTPGNRFFVVTLDFDALFDIEITTATYNASSTAHRPHFFRGVLDIRSTSLAYMVWTLETQLAAGMASGADTSMAANHLRGMGWGETTSDATGTCTVALKIRSDGAAATQTCRLHNLTIRKVTPT